jgi:DNA uptake protein ComE-like DNA-binding protein
MVLSILGMGLSAIVFQEIKFARAYRRSAISLSAARSALRAAFYLRKNDLTSSYDTLQELSRENRLDFCPDTFCTYYYVDKIDSAENTKVIDESALINLNTASTEVLKGLPGITDELADNITDSGLRPFRSINEILLVEGVTKESFLLFKDLVTVHGTGRININTAGKEVFLALGLEEELADAIIRFRNEHIIEPPKDSFDIEPEYGISTLATLLEDLSSFVSLGLRQEQDLLSLLPKFDVKSEYLRFNVVCDFGQDKGLYYSIVIHPATEKIISWKEN